MIKPIQVVMAEAADEIAISVLEALRAPRGVPARGAADLNGLHALSHPREFEPWQAVNGIRTARGIIDAHPAEVVLVPAFDTGGFAFLQERGLTPEECVAVFSAEPRWSARASSARFRRRTRDGTPDFLMSMARISAGKKEKPGFPWQVCCHSQECGLSAAHQIAADYFINFGRQIALGMEPWGQRKGMRGLPKVGDVSSVLTAFTQAQDEQIAFPSSKIRLVGSFCPNVTLDRCALTTTLVSSKVKRFASAVSAILRLLGSQVEEMAFDAIGPDFMEHPDLLPLLHPNILAQSQDILNENLRANWRAFETVVEQVKVRSPNPEIVTLRSFVKSVGPHLDLARRETEGLHEIITRLVDEFRKTVPHYAKFDPNEARARVKADVILYLAQARAAAEKTAVLLGVEVSPKYWVHLWEYLKTKGIAPPLFWLPAQARQHFSFEQ